MRVVQQHLGVAAVGTPDEQDDVRAARVQGRHAGGVERARRHVDDPGAGGKAHPVAGLRGDRTLVADDGQPQAAAGARAGEH